MTSPDWIAAELSFANLRIWLMQGMDVVEALKHRIDDKTLPEILASLPQLPIIMTDLTGRLGQEKPAIAPCNAQLRSQPFNLAGHAVHLVQGVQQSKPAMQMQGQTAYIAGILAAAPEFDGVICVLGEHSFWTRISAGEICYFQGYLTGDLLDHIGGAELPGNAASQPEFQSALDEAISRPQRAYGHLLNQKGRASVELAGSLIGLELADAKSYWLGETVIITGPTNFASLYTQALRQQGVTVHNADYEATLLAGLHRFFFTENILPGSGGAKPPVLH